MDLQGTGLWHKLWAGSSTRASRLHDELGRMVRPSYALKNMPRALTTGAARLLTGYLPARPWISYTAQAEIARFCKTRRVRMIEFGSGQSTLWYASRVSSLISIESDPDWYARIARDLAGLAHVDYRLAQSATSYANPSVEGPFDLVMIDGGWRQQCVAFALDRLADGALVYLDNSDKGAGEVTGDVPMARQMLIDFAESNGLPWREYTDFAPAQLFVQRGLMVGGSRVKP